MGALEKDLSVCSAARWGRLVVMDRWAREGEEQRAGGGYDEECCNWDQIMTILSSVQIMRQEQMKGTGPGWVPTVRSLFPHVWVLTGQSNSL